jgi:uncharacterized membrane protein HdeD (DUF308 family)
MSDQNQQERHNWWELVLAGVLAIAFGIAAVALPAGILSARILDLIFGVAKPFSGSMTAIAALLALVALVGTDGLLNLLGKSVTGKRASAIRGFIGIAVAIVAIFWPERTVFVAVEVIGVWAILVGILEMLFARHSNEDAKSRALRVIAGIASIAVGVGLMRWAFVGAIVVSALVGIAAAARGTSLIMIGVSHRLHEDDNNEKRIARDAA